MTIRILKPPPADPYFVPGLEQIVAHAKAGDLRGGVFLLNYPTTYAHWQGGHYSLETMVTALESWKWHQFSKRLPR